MYLLFHLSTCFEHSVLIVRRVKLYQYIIWYMSLCVGDCLVCLTGIPSSHLHSYWRYNPLWVCILQPSSGAIASSRTRFLDHTQRCATVGKTPLDEWSVRRRDLYLTMHNTHNRQTSMSPDSHLQSVKYTTCCIDTIWLYWWWAQGCSKYVEKWNNKYIEKSASSWLLTRIIPRCTVKET